MYGEYNLQRGDRDDQLRYGGAVRSRAAGEPLPLPGGVPYVAKLQRDLRELGFAVVGPDDGVFGRRTEWAVREFQIYAKSPFLARELRRGERYAERLVERASTRRYTGHVSGVVNERTRSLLEHWLLERCRCPVVIEAWELEDGKPIRPVAENVWLAEEVTAPEPRFYARDFGRSYPFPPGRDPRALQPLGEVAPAAEGGGARARPPVHCWREAEVLPQHLAGRSLRQLLDAPADDRRRRAQLSTFKVVRAVAEVACLGYFDSWSAGGAEIVALGPCRWTLGAAVDGAAVDGELAACLSFLEHLDAATFRQAVEIFGVRVDKEWRRAGAAADGRDLFDPDRRIYRAWLTLQQEDGSFHEAPRAPAEAACFASWHWLYRFAMAGRTLDGFRRALGAMARLRLRDLLATPWPDGAAPALAGGADAPRPATLGDVYTSECAVALLLLWHLRQGDHVIRAGRVAPRLVSALARAGLDAAAGGPESWGDDEEAALIAGLLQEAQSTGDGDLEEILIYVQAWPLWSKDDNPHRYALDPAIGALARSRRSFFLDDAGLPPAAR